MKISISRISLLRFSFKHWCENISLNNVLLYYIHICVWAYIIFDIDSESEQQIYTSLVEEYNPERVLEIAFIHI